MLPETLTKPLDNGLTWPSPAQAGMLFQSAAAPGRGIYIQQVVCTLDNERHPLDVAALRAAWANTISAHAALRVVFPVLAGGRMAAVVEPVVELDWEILDWRDGHALEGRLEAWLATDRERDIDPIRGPLMRLALIQLSDDDHRFVWTFHHAILDGRSRATVLSEAFERYAAHLARAPMSSGHTNTAATDDRSTRPALDAAPSVDSDASATFWRAALAGFAAATAVELGRAPLEPPTGAASYATVCGLLSEATTAALTAFARAEGITVGTVITGVWALVVGRCADADDVVVGTTRAFREATSGAQQVGMRINTPPLRVRLPDEVSVGDWLRDVRRSWMAARDFVETPLSEIQAASDVPRGEVLFETIVVYDHARLETRMRALGGPWATRAVSLRQTPHYALSLGAYGESELAFELDYDAQRFERHAVDRLLGQLTFVLESITQDSDLPLGAVSLLSREERAAVLALSCGIESPMRSTRLDDLFLAQAALTPSAVAVTHDANALTYAELSARSRTLAQVLREQGVAPGALVGVMLARSVQLPVGLLACLMADAVYVPLDPAWPAARIDAIVSDADIRYVVCESPGADHAELEEISWIPVDAEPRDPASARLGEGDRSAATAAYLIFTSGSQGRPNGVLCRHDAVVNLIDDFSARQPLGAGDRASLFTSIGFDVSLYELFTALLSGATLDIAPDTVRLDGRSFAEWLLERGVTSAYVPPHALPALADALEARSGRTRLRRLLVGVEPILERLLGRITTACPELVVINGYGPTEATICTTLHDVAQGGSTAARVPIGRPVRNTRSYVLDRTMRPQPIGLTGELFIGGAGLALGYLDRPALNVERFVRAPATLQTEGRLYRTGDRARWLDDGTLEFLGRLDAQVKIRGVRVEPGEVEAALTQDAEVREAAVVVRTAATGAQLVAYLVAHARTIDVSAVRARLRARLPEALVPQHLVVLDALPLTSSGKLDRKALPPPELDRSAAATGYLAPRTAHEHLISGAFAEVLGLERVGVHDSFFDLGGHSLLAMRLVARLEDLFDRHIPVAILFESPNVVALARHLTQARPLHLRTVVQLSGDGAPGLFLFPGARGGVLYLRDAARRLAATRAVYGISYPGMDGASEPVVELAELVSMLADAIQRQQPEGPYHLAGHCIGGLLAYEVARELLTRGARVGFLGLLDQPRPRADHGVPSGASKKRRWQLRRDLVPRLRFQVAQLARELQAAGRDPKTWSKQALAHAIQTGATIIPKSVRLYLSSHRWKWFHGLRHFVRAELVDHSELAPAEVVAVYMRAVSALRVGSFPQELTVLRAAIQPLASTHNDDMGWAQVAPNLVVRTLPGDHQTIFDLANLDAMAAEINAGIERSHFSGSIASAVRSSSPLV